MDFKASDICRIIKECAKSGVTKLKLSDVEIEFQSPNPDVVDRPVATIPLESRPTPRVLERQEEDEINVLKEDSIRLREEEIENLPISNPQYFEELLAQGELLSADQEPGRT